MSFWRTEGRIYKVGDKVRVKYSGVEGYIISIDNNLCMVSMEDEK